MAQLLVRNLEDDLVRRLKKRAGEAGVSVEEEHRRILRKALDAIDSAENMDFKEFLMTFPEVDDPSVFERDRSLPGRSSDQGLFDDMGIQVLDPFSK